MITEATGPVKFASVSEVTAASNELVAAVASHQIRLLGGFLVAANSVTVTIEDEDGNDLTGPMSLIAGTPLTLPVNGLGYLDCTSGKALHLLLGGAVQVSGAITYQEIVG